MRNYEKMAREARLRAALVKEKRRALKAGLYTQFPR